MRRIARAVWIACFLVGAGNHARQLIAGGWLPYRFAPMPLNLFWTALLPIDLAVAALLWWRHRAGPVSGVAVMLVDVGANSWFAYRIGYPGLATAIQLQTLFLGFVLGSAAWLSQESRPSG